MNSRTTLRTLGASALACAQLMWVQVVGATAITPGMEPSQILQAVNMFETERLMGVEQYVERIRGNEIPGLQYGLGPGQQGPCTSNCRVYTTVDVRFPNGQVLKKGHLLSPDEVAVLAGAAPDSARLAYMGEGYGLMQDELARNADQLGPMGGLVGIFMGDDASEMTNRRVQRDIENRTWEDTITVPGSEDGEGGGTPDAEGAKEWEAPWLNPLRMFGGGAYFYNEAAVATKNAELSLQQSGAQALEEAAAQDQLLDDARTVGIEEVDGQSAVRIDLPVPPGAAAQMQGEAGQSFQPKTASVWVAQDKPVILKHRVEGVATAEGQSRDFFVETVHADFRDVPGSEMYQPYKRVMRMGGMLDDKQMAEMEEARKQLEEFDRQLASMPPAQRQMAERMMGGQMDAVRSLANNGAFEYVEVIDEILVNPDLKVLFAAGLSATSLQPASDDLLVRIQVDLTTLGYEPGNTQGVLDTMTQIAISQFQAEKGLTVSGEPSPELAASLAAEVARR